MAQQHAAGPGAPGSDSGSERWERPGRKSVIQLPNLIVSGGLEGHSLLMLFLLEYLHIMLTETSSSLCWNTPRARELSTSHGLKLQKARAGENPRPQEVQWMLVRGIPKPPATLRGSRSHLPMTLTLKETLFPGFMTQIDSPRCYLQRGRPGEQANVGEPWLFALPPTHSFTKYLFRVYA